MSIDPVSGTAAAALLSTAYAQSWSTRQHEVSSETVCWALLPFLFVISKRTGIHLTSKRESVLNGGEAKQTSKISLWIFALCVATHSLCRAEQNTDWLIPTITPLFLAAHTALGIEDAHLLSATGSWSLPALVNTVWGSCLAGLFSIVTLADWTWQGLALATASATASFIIFLNLACKPTASSSRFLPSIDLSEDASQVCVRVVVVLVGALYFQYANLAFPIDSLAPILIHGVLKAISWCSLALAARHTSWRIAVPIISFSVFSTINPLIQTSEIQAIMHVVGSTLFLSQAIGMIPKSPKILWASALVFLLPYAYGLFSISSFQWAAKQKFNQGQTHPVLSLMTKAKADFDEMTQRQSKTYTAAHTEYKRRYGLEPPPGFEAWYEFAVINQSPIIDDFDAINSSIAPLLAVSGRDVLESLNTVYSANDSEVWFCHVSSQHPKTECHHPHRTFDRHISLLFHKVLNETTAELPDINFLVNHLDEPRVLAPSPDSPSHIDITDMSYDSTWDTVTEPCRDPNNEGSHTGTDRHTDGRGFHFVENPSLEMNLCEHPEYETMHGFFQSPASFTPIKGNVPVLSTGSLSTMGDILFPSPAYLEPGFKYDETSDIDWLSKKNNLYWAGSSSGAYATDNQWKHFHRQRLVDLVQNPQHRRQDHQYLVDEEDLPGRSTSSFLNHRLFDVAFTRILQCDRQACRDQSDHFQLKPWTHKDRPLRSRLNFDLDGNGMSGRFYKLLASKSLPLKQTLFREWHDERLVPWFHYVPVSQNMEELPELVTFLTSTPRGEDGAREIAEQGREWFSKAFREVDFTIYLYRLLLELARLQDPDREAIAIS